jgi:hypothetical protein
LQEFLERDGLVSVCLVFGGFSQHLIDGVQQVPAQGLQAPGASLSELDEVVDEDVGVADGALVGAVGRSGDGDGCVRRRRRGPERTQGGQACGGCAVLWFSRLGDGRQVVEATGGLFQSVRSDGARTLGEVGVGEVGHGFGHGARRAIALKFYTQITG